MSKALPFLSTITPLQAVSFLLTFLLYIFFTCFHQNKKRDAMKAAAATLAEITVSFLFIFLLYIFFTRFHQIRQQDAKKAAAATLTELFGQGVSFYLV